MDIDLVDLMYAMDFLGYKKKFMAMKKEELSKIEKDYMYGKVKLLDNGTNYDDAYSNKNKGRRGKRGVGRNGELTMEIAKICGRYKYTERDYKTGIIICTTKIKDLEIMLVKLLKGKK
jgi:hypothetical protein